MKNILDKFHSDRSSNCEENLLWTQVLDGQTNQQGPAVCWQEKQNTLPQRENKREVDGKRQSRPSEEVPRLKITLWEKLTDQKAKTWKGNTTTQVRSCQVEKEKKRPSSTL